MVCDRPRRYRDALRDADRPLFGATRDRLKRADPIPDALRVSIDGLWKAEFGGQLDALENLRCRMQQEPDIALSIILGNALTPFIIESEHELRLRSSLFSRLAEPESRLRSILQC
jgi:hypothetical protein